MQPIAFVGEAASITEPLLRSTRIQDNILARRERAVLDWLCAHMPRAVTPDMLTASGVAGALLVFAGYAASRFDPAFLWLATLGFIAHWFGDSLDGSLARYRRIERPRYGYFLDHSIDALCNLAIMAGAGISVYIRLDAALFALLGYYMLCMYVFLYNHVSHSFRLSFLALGPTELRVSLVAINCWMYFAGESKLTVGHQVFSPYDLVLFGAGLVFIILFSVNVFDTARQLRLEDQADSLGGGGPDNGRFHKLSRKSLTLAK